MLVEDPSACCVAKHEPSCQWMWLVGKLLASIPSEAPPCLSAACAPVSDLILPPALPPHAQPSAATLSKGDDHKMNLWGESSFSSSPSPDERESVRWYHKIPMPTVEPVDKEL